MAIVQDILRLVKGLFGTSYCTHQRSFLVSVCITVYKGWLGVGPRGEVQSELFHRLLARFRLYWVKMVVHEIYGFFVRL